MPVNVRIGLQVRLCQVQQPAGGSGSSLLQMNECSSQLDQCFVECAVGTVPLLQPKRLQHFVGFKIELAIEAIEKAEIVRIQLAALPELD